MSRLSFNEMTSFRWNFEEDISQAAALGYTAIGLCRQKLGDFGVQEGMALLAAMGLRVSNVCWAGGFTGSDGRNLIESIADATEAIRLTAALRAGCLVVYSGARGGHTTSHARRLFREAIDRLLPSAEDFGVTLGIKAVHTECAIDCGLLTSLAEASEFVRSFDHPRVKLAFDTYHLGWDQDVPLRLAEAASDIAIVHLSDGLPPSRGETHCCRLGEGDVPLRAILAALEHGGYEGDYDVKLVGAELDSGDYRDLMTHSQSAMAELLPSVAYRG
ncbi:MAG TPA: sugar phosphate isomerase/epimerase family protein [Pirellulales bacterium]|nr:sugar phosphate isomerase/epimerase family protein [Pirellulales bacterium]